MSLRKIEVFTAGCSLCDDAVQLVHRLVCESCEVEVLDMGNTCGTAQGKGLWRHPRACDRRQRETRGLLPERAG